MSLSLILDSEFTKSFNIKFSDCSWAIAGSASSAMCLLVLCSNFARYTSLSRTTVLLPLSAGIIIMELSLRRAFSAFYSAGDKFDFVGLYAC